MQGIVLGPVRAKLCNTDSKKNVKCKGWRDLQPDERIRNYFEAKGII